MYSVVYLNKEEDANSLYNDTTSCLRKETNGNYKDQLRALNVILFHLLSMLKAKVVA